MSLFRRASSESIQTPGRPRAVGGHVVTPGEALGHSVVWGATRLRADLISLMPVDVFSPKEAIAVKVPPSPLLVQPSEIAEGHPITIGEWLGSGQMSLDRHGNNFGLITATDGFGKPARVDLVRPEDVTVRIRDGKILSYRIRGELTDPKYVWHERQFTVAGLPIGLSAVAHAALTLAGASAAQEFAVNWFVNGAAPSAHLKNEDRIVPDAESAKIKARYNASVQTGDVFVTGKDWTYSPLAANAAESAFLEQMRYSEVELARFFGVPADLVDVQVQSSTINYANITQRNLQLLVMNLGAAIKRREDALSATCAGRRYVKLNRDAILAMDAKTRAELFALQINSRQRTPDEARQKDDLAPLGEADYVQFDRLFGARVPNQPQTSGGN